MTARLLAAAWAAVLTCALVACGGSSSQPDRQTSGAAAPGLKIEVTIANGQVTPTNATLRAKVNEQITLRITSDVTDELHVHSVPDHKFEIAAAPNQTFQFSVDVPGNVDVELHHLKRTIATIQVQP
jgi:heme/copper-type cytochrome/quinol oxidase subunit 2